MSATSTPVTKAEVKEKKPRTPTLPAKFGKFIQFGYWFMLKLNQDVQAPAVDETLFIEKINLFADVESQQAFVQEFFDQAKDINKNIRQLVKDRNKEAIKANKLAIKAQAKALSNANKPTKEKNTKEKNTKEKKPRVKKDKPAHSSEDAFVNEIVQIANAKPKKNKNNKENDDNTQVSVLNLNGTQYLIDDNNRVYHFNNHSIIGIFDPNNHTIIESK